MQAESVPQQKKNLISGQSTITLGADIFDQNQEIDKTSPRHEHDEKASEIMQKQSQFQQ